MEFTDKFLALHHSLMTLCHQQSFIERGRLYKLQRTLRSCAEQLQVARVSVWHLNDTQDCIHCEQLLIQDENRFDSGLRLLRSDYPDYFDAITSNRLINANDARQDPRTAEFSQGYLQPLNIYSMLDAPIFLRGRLQGVLCIEHTGSCRQWDIAEMSYAASVADSLSLLNEHENWLLSQQKLSLIEQTDSLTGLINRRTLQQHIEHDLQNQQPQLRALVLLGLDFFTSINDSYGPQGADQLLTTLAQRFQQLANNNRLTVARIGGDIFGFWLAELQGQTQLDNIVELLQQQLRSSIRIMDVDDVEVSASTGIVIYPQQGESIQDPIRCAELAMQRAKTQAKGSVEYFSVDWLDQLLRQRGLESELLTAFSDGQLIPHYQPLVSVTGDVVGIEALVRWQHPQRGLIPPYQFLPLATQLGLMAQLGDIMLEHACRDMQTLQQQRLAVKWVSVNISSEQLYDPQLAMRIEQLLARYNLSSSMLELEVVEELISQDSDMVSAQLDTLSEMGIQLAIDDFGTGYSSLSRLKYLPVSKLKIDKSFVDGLPEAEQDRCIARSIIGLAKGMNVALVAEGVECEAQAEWLIDNGCDFLQGYHYAKPMGFEQLIAFVRDNFGAAKPAAGD